jgi:DNA-binding transcriptional ArsR family regulator
MDPFEALAHPHRRAILQLLAEGEQSAGALAAAFPSVSRPAISWQLRALREAGLVRVRSSGRSRLYALDPAGLDAPEAWLQARRDAWARRLDTIKELAEDGGD